ncbi:MAG TPA: EAL domain-containing protein [Gemmatimonadota bacterium]|nr:EAL domain-containing protein [Gemmatimonadota bacterium]
MKDRRRLFVLKPADMPRRPPPSRALGISVLALVAAGVAGFVRVEQTAQTLGLVWVLALVPPFLLSYYRGWSGAVVALIGGMVVLTLVELVGGSMLQGRIDWWVYGSAAVSLIVVSLGAGVTTEFLHRAGGDPHLADRQWQTGRELKRALESGDFLLHFDPIVDLATGRVQGVEALVRWKHGSGGLLPPDLFLPTAEATGLIIPLGYWILAEACRAYGAWRNALPEAEGFFVAVNLSTVQCRDDDDLAVQIRRILGEHDVPRRALQFEIRETGLLQVGDRVQEIKETGVQVVIDDFGTENSSLSYLTWLDVDGLKMDRGFVSDLPDDARSAAIVHSTIDLATELGLWVTGEGVESHAQREWLLGAGCRYGQGFLFGQALPLEAALREARASWGRGDAHDLAGRSLRVRG